MGTTPKTLSQLLNGQANISNDLAKKLSTMLGTSVDLWLNLQKSYDKKIIEIETEKGFDEQAFISRLIDYTYFIKVANLPKCKNLHDKTANLCKYFKVADLRIMTEPDFLISYKTQSDNTDQKHMINSKAWVQTAINMAESITVNPYDPIKLKKLLPKFRELTTQDFTSSICHIKELLADAGVAFVLLPPLKNSYIDGAVKWINDTRVILAMNSKGDDIGKFWFSFFHEIRHILQKKLKTVFVSNSSNEIASKNALLEEDANRFASDFLIPPKEYKKLNLLKAISDKNIISFAESIGVHPSIVVERLQQDNILPGYKNNKFQKKYCIE